jgi:hypothetical protein
MVKTVFLENPNNTCEKGNIPKTIYEAHANKNTFSGYMRLKANTRKASTNKSETKYKSNIKLNYNRLLRTAPARIAI